MDKHTFRVLEFDRVLEMAAAFAVTAPGRHVIKEIRPLQSIDEIRRRIHLASECRRLLSEGRSLGIEHFDDLSPLFKRVRPSDSVIEPFELRSFLPLMFSALNMKELSDDPAYGGLGDVVSRLTTHRDIKVKIDQSIDREGKIRDEASPELASVRRGIRSFEGKIKTLLDGILKREDLVPHLQDFYVTQRNNRWVIPVKRDFKGHVPGVVHDISNTGETVFIEPYSVQQIGNDLESLRSEEKLEEYRILRRLTALLREDLPDIEADYHIVAEADALQAIALFSDTMDMTPPEINQKGYMKIIHGRHPLLWKALKKDHREHEIVPLDLEMGKGHSCMVITGSNAGGKTVALKTIGIVNLMALSGMHVPADSGTVIPFLDRVFADIGDDQSIDQNLSTFSAHIKRISGILEQSGDHSLIIIDELGTGTDPEQGGALSCAILRQLKVKKALTVISTHLGMLKAFAHSEPGMINSAMEMKEVELNGTRTYTPTYHLVVGEPGTSHAFEIAESLGLQEDIIRDARSLIAGEDIKVESLISDLKEKTRAVEKRLKETEDLRKEAASIQSSLENELAKIKASKQEALSRALREAEDIVRRAKNEAHDIIRQLKKAKQSDTGSVMKDLDRKHMEIKKAQSEITPETVRALREIITGKNTFIRTLGINGVIQSVNEKTGKCTVLAKGKEISVSVKDLFEPVREKTGHSEIKRKERYTAEYSSVDADIPHEMKVIGQHVEPALALIDRYLNDVSLSGVNRIKIIHGIGTGKLASAIREYLKEHPLVESSRKGEEEEGGDAVTIVYL